LLRLEQSLWAVWLSTWLEGHFRRRSEPEDLQMPNSAHYWRRAERLRLALLLTPSPVAAARLRNFVEKYRVLAERADKRIASPPLNPVEDERALIEKADLSVD
jgi:hypothetical protein